MKKNPFETKSAEAMEVKRLTQPFSVEKLSESDGTFSGRGMVFDTLHPTSSWQLGPEWKDRVRPGAFTETLAAHDAAGTKPMMLYMHERGNVPGVWTDIKETKGALVLSGQVSKSAVTPSGVPLLELMKMGAITGLSIGFRPTKVVLDDTKKIRDILSVDLGEVSVVDIPGNDAARITDVKHDIRNLEEGLRSLGLTKKDAKALLAKGFEGLVAEQAHPEALAATKLSRQAVDSSANAEELTAAADQAHGNAMVAHFGAAAAHVAAAHDRGMASKQAADKGDAAASSEHKAAADKHSAQADKHTSAASTIKSSYGFTSEGLKADVGEQKSPDPADDVLSIADRLKESLSRRDADGARRDAASGTVELNKDLLGFAGIIKSSI